MRVPYPRTLSAGVLLWLWCLMPGFTQTPIACDGDLSGNLNTTTQVDQYTFDAGAGDIIIIRMQADGSSVTPKIQLTGPGVNQTDIGSFSDPARIGALQLQQGGTFSIAASDDGSNATGAYGLSLQVIKAPCATPIGCTDDINSTLGKKAEMDAYSFDVTAAGEYVIARMQQDGSSIYGHLELFKVGATAPVATDAGSYSDPARIDATNLQPGTYVLLVMDEDGVYTGNYGLSLQFVKAPCATPIGCTDDISAALGKKAEIDAYTFEVTTAGEYVIARMQQDGSSIYGHLELFKVGATAPVATDAGSYSDPARIDATNLQPGTYVLLVMDEDGVYTGSYGLSLQFVKADCATPIGCTDDVNGNLGKKAEMDAYTFDVTTAGEYVIARMQQDDSSINGHLELFKVGVTAPINTDAGSYSDPARIDAPNLQPGTYVLLVMDEDGVYVGGYGLSLQFVKAYCATPIGLTDDVNGNLGKKAEIDAYTFDVPTAGEYVIARMQQDGSSIYGHLELYKEGSTAPFFTNDGSYSDPARLDATNLQPGTYVLLVMDKNGGYLGNYGLSVQFVKASCATPIGCADVVNGNLGKKAEMDAYTFDVTTAGEYVIARMQQDGSSINGHLELFKVGASAPVATDDGSYSDPARIDAPNLQPGIYVLLVMDKNGGYFGNYSLSFQAVRSACATVVADCPYSASNQISAKAAIRSFAFNTASGAIIQLSMSTSGSFIKPRIELYDPTGKRINEADGTSTATLPSVNISDPGIYTLVCMDQTGNNTGTFSISISGCSNGPVPCVAPSATWESASVTLCGSTSVVPAIVFADANFEFELFRNDTSTGIRRSGTNGVLAFPTQTVLQSTFFTLRARSKLDNDCVFDLPATLTVNVGQLNYSIDEIREESASNDDGRIVICVESDQITLSYTPVRGMLEQYPGDVSCPYVYDITGLRAGLYTIHMSSPSGCKTDTILRVGNPNKLRIEFPEKLLVTPNGDGKNDVLYLEGLLLYPDSNALTVYNRFGSVVYSAKPYWNNWSPEELPNDTYFYTLQLFEGKNELEILTGFITVFR